MIWHEAVQMCITRLHQCPFVQRIIFIIGIVENNPFTTQTPRKKYATYLVDGKELLFDNILDPFQMTNLIDDGSHASTKNKLKSGMLKKMKEINDDFPVSTWYRDNWISEDRCIIKTARCAK